MTLELLEPELLTPAPKSATIQAPAQTVPVVRTGSGPAHQGSLGGTLGSSGSGSGALPPPPPPALLGTGGGYSTPTKQSPRVKLISKTRLINYISPDSDIADMKSSHPRVHVALRSMGDGSKQLINAVFPPPPIVPYRSRIILPGVLAAGNDILAHRYHVVLPQDPSGYWTYQLINLSMCYITAKVMAASTPLSIDIKISQRKGATPFKSIFKPGFNPILPPNIVSTHDTEFAIGQFFQDDLGRVDILAADGTVAGVELVLIGNYQYTQNNIK